MVVGTDKVHLHASGDDEGTLVLAADGTVKSIHGVAARLLNVRPNEVIGSPVNHIRLFRSVGPQMLQTLRALGGPLRLNMAAHSRQAITAWADLIESDQGQAILIRLTPSTAIDWPAEAALDPDGSREWSSTLFSAMDGAGIGILVCAPDIMGDLVVRHANRAASLILGHDIDELEGSDGLWPRDPPVDRDGFTPWKRPDGNLRSLKVRTEERKLFNRRATIYFLQDLTVQRRREAHRQELLEELHLKNQDLAIFSRSMAHDLKEPVRNMAAFADVLARRLDGDLAPRDQEMLEFIQNGGRRATAMIDNLMRFIRLGSAAAKYQNVDLNAVLTEVHSDLDPTLPGNVEIDWTTPESVRGDPDLIKLLLQNLIINGIKYNEAAQIHVHITSRCTPHGYEIDVADNGIGIPTGSERSIFEPFTRVHTRHADGTGIGLAICRRIVEIHGGTIHGEPRRGSGTRFEIRWPHNGQGLTGPEKAVFTYRE